MYVSTHQSHGIDCFIIISMRFCLILPAIDSLARTACNKIRQTMRCHEVGRSYAKTRMTARNSSMQSALEEKQYFVDELQ